MAERRGARPVPVGQILASAIPGLDDRMLEARIRGAWPVTVGPDLAGRSRPGELRQGVLSVTVDNSPWLHEMTLRSGELLSAVQARHGAAVTSLRFTLGAIATARPAVRPSWTAPAARLSAEEERSVEAIAAAVADPALAVSLRRLLTKDLIARRRPAASPAVQRENP